MALGKALAVIGFAFALAGIGCRQATAPPGQEAAAAPGELRVPRELRVTGKLVLEPLVSADETITVRTSAKVGFDEDKLSYVSSPVDGRVVELRARPGDFVEPGQTLAVIDSPALGEAWSDFAKARADQGLAEHSLKLAQDLVALRTLAAKELQKASDDLTKANADLRRTRERLLSLGIAAAELDVPLDDLHVRSRWNLTSPIAGTVVDRSLTLGQVVGGDGAQKPFVVADLRELWVTADVYEKDLRYVGPGDPVRVEVAPWPGRIFDGRIEYVGSTVDPATHTVKVRAAVDNADLLLKPEMFASATIETAGATSVLSAPLEAVHGEASGQPYVFVALDDGGFVRRAVTLGARSGERVAIVSGLTPAERVVTKGSILLKAEADRQSRG